MSFPLSRLNSETCYATEDILPQGCVFFPSKNKALCFSFILPRTAAQHKTWTMSDWSAGMSRVNSNICQQTVTTWKTRQADVTSGMLCWCRIAKVHLIKQRTWLDYFHIIQLCTSSPRTFQGELLMFDSNPFIWQLVTFKILHLKYNSLLKLKPMVLKMFGLWPVTTSLDAMISSINNLML